MGKMDEIIERLRDMAVNTMGLACLGCGFEHGCSVHGCALLKEVAQILIDLQWRDAETELPPEGELVIAVVSGRPAEHIELVEAYQTARVYADEGWIIEEWPAWEAPTVHRWMPIPE